MGGDNMLLTKVTSVVSLSSFTVFPEYFLATTAIYLLIVVSLITYNNYGLILQKALSNCLGLAMLLACYLILNDELMAVNFLFGNGSNDPSNDIICSFFSFHNSVVNDHFGYFTKLLVCFFSSIYLFFIANSLKKQNIVSFEYLVVVLFAIIGLMLLCSSQDLLTAYLAIELSSLSSYILAAFKKTSTYSIEAGIKYFVTGAISSALFLLGSSFVYFFCGSVNLTDINELTTTAYSSFLSIPTSDQIFETYRNKYPNIDWNWNNFLHSTKDMTSDKLVILDLMIDLAHNLTLWKAISSVQFTNNDLTFISYGFSLILFSLFIKLALAPFHLWSLDVYEGSPTNSSFFFAAIAKLSVFVFLVRLCYFGFSEFYTSWQFYSIYIAILSVFVGSFGGLKQRRIKTLLAYSSTSHMGYSLLALSSGHVFGLQMLIFYLIIYMISGLCTWYIILFLRQKRTSGISKHNKELADFALLRKSHPIISFSLALTLFSIAGIPPLIGFLVKMGVFLGLIKSGLYSVEFYTAALLSILCSVVSTFYYIRIVKVLYFENILIGKLYYPINSENTVILGCLLLLLVFLFINPSFLFLYIYKVVLLTFNIDGYYLFNTIINS